MTKTITLYETTKKGIPILYSGNPSKKELGRWGFYRSSFQHPISLEIFPEIAISGINSEKGINLHFYLKELNEVSDKYDAQFHTRFEQRIGKRFGESYFDGGLFHKELTEINSLKGETLISAHRTIKLLESAKKIPTYKIYQSYPEKEWCNGMFTKFNSYSEIKWTDLFKEMFDNATNMSKSYYFNHLIKPLDISRNEAEQILNIHPLDDNLNEIKEGDLVKIILGDVK